MYLTIIVPAIIIAILFTFRSMRRRKKYWCLVFGTHVLFFIQLNIKRVKVENWCCFTKSNSRLKNLVYYIDWSFSNNIQISSIGELLFNKLYILFISAALLLFFIFYSSFFITYIALLNIIAAFIIIPALFYFNKSAYL